jgi:hypothetical protein
MEGPPELRFNGAVSTAEVIQKDKGEVEIILPPVIT